MENLEISEFQHSRGEIQAKNETFPSLGTTPILVRLIFLPTKAFQYLYSVKFLREARKLDCLPRTIFLRGVQ